MRRRDFIKAITASAAAWPLPLGAQQAAKVYLIGYLGSASHAGYAREIEGAAKGLAPARLRRGKKYYHPLSVCDRLPALAAELVTSKVDVLLTHGTPGARAARQATSAVPIVVMAAADLVSSGLVSSIARPAGI